ncbi:MAG: LysM peptidoglycan-binding domain-containing protein [Firmicutes bacterium]|nr:LysM peptidoglycan-binding domain-containing protein [Candidatus Fermentithermobacillaceae bacterium]
MKRPAPPGAPAPPAARIEYVVQPGDTLFLIARRHGLTLEEILRANPQITNPQLIMPGEVVFIPARVAPAPPPGMFRRYVVQPGDTMFLIARKFGISLQELVRANPGVDPDLILPGQVINVPSPTGAVG